MCISVCISQKISFAGNTHTKNASERISCVRIFFLLTKPGYHNHNHTKITIIMIIIIKAIRARSPITCDICFPKIPTNTHKNTVCASVSFCFLLFNLLSLLCVVHFLLRFHAYRKKTFGWIMRYWIVLTTWILVNHIQIWFFNGKSANKILYTTHYYAAW